MLTNNSDPDDVLTVDGTERNMELLIWRWRVRKKRMWQQKVI